jgi:hypothetical protein
VFSGLGGFVAQCGSFPPDTESARAFQQAGGRWLAAQFGDPATDQANRQQFTRDWAARWRAKGVLVGAWWRVEHLSVNVPALPQADLLVPNPETPAELGRLPAVLDECSRVGVPLAVVTLGKAHAFPTGLLAAYDAHLIPECFLETAAADTTVTNSVRFWKESGVDAARIHPCLLHKPGPDRYPVRVAAAEAHTIGVSGLSSFTAENTPADAWAVMA